VADQDTPISAPATKPGAFNGDAGAERAMVAICALLIGLAGLFVFAAVTGIPFNGRDLTHFILDGSLRRVVTAPEAFGWMPHAPLTVLGLAFNAALMPAPALLHASSLFLHLFCAVLVYLCARKFVPKDTPEPIIMLGGLIWAVGPLAAGSLSFVSGRASLQAAVFALLALYVFLNAPRAGLSALALMLAAYAAAFASHFGALALPLALIGADFVLGGPENLRKNARIHAAMLFFMLAFASARAAAGIGGPDYASGLGAVLHGQAVFLSQTISTAFLLGSAPALPGTVSEAQLSTVGTLITAAAALLAAGAVFVRARAGIGLWWLLMAAAAAPCVTPGGELLGMGEGYLAGLGIALALPALLAQLPQPVPRAAGAVLALVLAVVGTVVSYRVTSSWTEPAARWQSEAEQTQSAGAWRNLAEFLYTLPVPEGAAPPQEQLLPALQQWRAKAPEDARAASLLGAALAAAGKAEEAAPVLEEALRLDPWNGAAAARLGALYEQRARQEGRERLLLARDYYQRAYELGALSKQQLEPFSLVLAAVGDIDAAARVLKEAIGDVQEGPAAAALKRFQSGQQQIAAREEKSRQLLAQETPGDTSGLVLRAEIEYLKGHYMQAFYLLSRLLRREESNAQAWSLLGLTKARMQLADGFLNEYGASPAATSAAWDDLAKRCAASNLWDAALAYLQKSPDGNAELRLATIAQEYRQPERVEALLKAAAEKAPADPLPWLRLCELALQAKDIARAGALLGEAQQRGAGEEQLKPLRDQMGAPSLPGAVPMQKIVN
jgi:hypothetical protein